jgi:poly(glycerol-phosphate) alpha-glucosyltransferase
MALSTSSGGANYSTPLIGTPPEAPQHYITDHMRDHQGAIVQLMGSMGLNRGGLTRAVYERTAFLGAQRPVVFASLNFQLDYDHVFSHVKASDAIPQHARLETFHDWAMRNGATGSPSEDTPLFDLVESNAEFQTAVEVGDNGNRFERLFYHGKFIAMRSYDSSGALVSIDHHDPTHPWLIAYRDRYDAQGRVRVREHLAEDFKPRFKTFFNHQGGAYLSHWVNGNGYEYRAVHFATKGVKQYKDLRALHRQWLKDLAKRVGPAVMFSDEPTTAFALNLSLPDWKLVGAIHTTHYSNLVDYNGGHKGWVPHYTRAEGKTASLVFFTPSQAEDFCTETGYDVSKTVVIPHAAPAQADVPAVHRDEHAFVVVSRLDRDKQVADALKAFRIASAKKPFLRLHIYGSGPDEPSLRRLAAELEVSEGVVFHGFTSEPLAAFGSAAAFVMTSKYEGFGLVITESFAAGTPVLAYDVKYGPHDLVRTDANGVLVEAGNIDQLADAMESVLSRSTWAKLSNGAVATAREFSRERWMHGWENLTDHLLTGREPR